MSQPTSPTILLFARGILAILDLWPALTIAVKEEWGGPESAEKKVWVASTIIDEFESKAVYLPEPTPLGPIVDPNTFSDPPLDQDDLADLLVQIMSDEFDANIEDGSIDAVSGDIVKLWANLLQPNPIIGTPEDVVGALERKAEEVKGRVVANNGGGPEVEGEDDDSEEDSGSEMDVDGTEEEAPQLVRREEPEVDDDGFTMVKGKGKSGR